jgi:hypothetical protein
MTENFEKPSFANGPVVPEMRVVQLTGEDVQALFLDLAAVAQVSQVVLKGSSTQYASQNSVTLENALPMLLSNSIRGMQVRYGYDGHEWTDTLFREADDQFRLVRCQHLPN